MIGTIGSGPQTAFTDASIAANRSGRSGEGGLGITGATGATSTDSSLITRRIVFSTWTGSSPGSIRQFTVAVAVCGNACSAWPAASSVGTHVVRSSALYNVVLLSRAYTAASAVPFATRRMSAATAGAAAVAALAKYAF